MVSKAQAKKVILSFPDCAEGTAWGHPAFKIGEKFFTRLRQQDDSLVMIVPSMDERDMLLELDPATYHITDHYKNYPAILVRLSELDSKSLRAMLERRYAKIAPKKKAVKVPAAKKPPAKKRAKAR